MPTKRKHIYPLFTEVAFLTPSGEVKEGLIISRRHKLPLTTGATIEDPYYIITGYGPAVYENDIVPLEHKNQLLGSNQ